MLRFLVLFYRHHTSLNLFHQFYLDGCLIWYGNFLHLFHRLFESYLLKIKLTVLSSAIQSWKWHTCIDLFWSHTLYNSYGSSAKLNITTSLPSYFDVEVFADIISDSGYFPSYQKFSKNKFLIQIQYHTVHMMYYALYFSAKAFVKNCSCKSIRSYPHAPSAGRICDSPRKNILAAVAYATFISPRLYTPV